MGGNGSMIIFLMCSIFLLGRFPSSASREKEKTLAIIKPDGFSGNYTGEIKRLILLSGFSILKEKIVHLDKENVALFYAEHSERTFFPSLVKYMTSGPVVVIVLEKVNAIADWRALIGPTDAQKAKITHPDSVRALCGLNSERNCVHGSDSPQSAAKEISFFFGEMFSSGEVIANHDEL
ncbi:hypothetical protein NE237_025229 [Protea cynaroides]|uniref:Nucleoside diphosphate kinase n=1 Tax=Protea cynaroides TaxID=273540 RepID=A0A9Q0H4I0_9MAGN|nr:hypothetical protein NE237_025229 [Protea cynaroides]